MIIVCLTLFLSLLIILRRFQLTDKIIDLTYHKQDIDNYVDQVHTWSVQMQGICERYEAEIVALQLSQNKGIVIREYMN